MPRGYCIVMTNMIFQWRPFIKRSRIILSRVHEPSYRQSSKITKARGSIVLFWKFRLLFYLFQYRFLPLKNILNDRRIVFIMDKQFWHHFAVKSVSFFSSRNYHANWNVLVIKRRSLTMYVFPLPLFPIKTTTGPCASFGLKLIEFIVNLFNSSDILY